MDGVANKEKSIKNKAEEVKMAEGRKDDFQVMLLAVGSLEEAA